MARFPKKTAYVACDGGERCHSCTYGCMSCSSCIEACRKDAVFYNEYGVAEIEESRCIGCGLCVKACPQEIIHIHVTDNPFIVKCSNKDKGAAAKKACEASCIGCGICARNCPADAVEVQDNVAEVNDELCPACGNCAEKCPRDVVRDTRGVILK